MTKFDTCFNWLMENEGGYVNNPKDPGGETNYGVTKSTAVEYGYKGSMKELPLATAKEICYRRYWRDWMDQAPMPLAFDLLDTSYHSGPITSAKLLQRSLNVKDDGIIGPKTMAAASSINPCKLWILFQATRLSYLTSCKTWDSFSVGFTNRVINNIKRGVSLLES